MGPVLAVASFHKQRFPLSRQMSVTIRSQMPDTKTHHPKWHHQAHGHKAVVMRSWNLSLQTSAARKSEPGCLYEMGQTRESELGIIYWIWSWRANISLPLKSEQVSDLYEADPPCEIGVLRPLNWTEQSRAKQCLNKGGQGLRDRAWPMVDKGRLVLLQRFSEQPYGVPTIKMSFYTFYYSTITSTLLVVCESLSF